MKFLLLLAYIITLALSSFYIDKISKLEWLSSSFQVNAERDKIFIRPLDPPIDQKDQPLTNNVYLYLKDNFSKNQWYTLSFYIQIPSEVINSENLFYSTNLLPASSIFFNLRLLEGKIQTGHVCSWSSVLLGKTLNDNRWHHLLISKNERSKIYLDGKLESSAPARDLCNNENWLVINTQNRIPGHKILLKEVTLVKEPLSPLKFNSIYASYFTGNNKPLLFDIFKSLLAYPIVIIVILLMTFLIIKRKYKSQKAYNIFCKLYPTLLLWIIGFVPFKTNSYYPLSFICLLLVITVLHNSFPRIIPSHLAKFANMTSGFAFDTIKFVITNKYKYLRIYLRPDNCLHLLYFLIFIGILLHAKWFLTSLSLF